MLESRLLVEGRRTQYMLGSSLWVKGEGGEGMGMWMGKEKELEGRREGKGKEERGKGKEGRRGERRRSRYFPPGVGREHRRCF